MDSAEGTPADQAAATADADPADPYVVDPVFVLRLAARRDRPLVPRTRVEYARRVALFLSWLRDAGPDHRHALITPEGRDEAVRVYLQHLKSLGRTPSTWNVTLAAVNAYFQFLGLGGTAVAPAEIRRVLTSPLGITEQSQLIATAQERAAHTRLFRIRRARNLAVVMVLLYGGLRESEAEALDADHVVLDGPRSFVLAPGRRVYLPRRARTALAEWDAERRELLGDLRIKAFFLAGDNDGTDCDLRRLSQRQIEDVVRDLGREAGLRNGDGIGPGVLRATHAQHVVADESDPAQVARRLGQVKPDLPQIHALRAAPPIQHPGRARPADREDTQLALDF
ncbi:tyrosine-type recombinase/integrase [Nocardia sp. NBC_01327]|uniref:tyrosine-type recombinase/integrase n=1 Tax=Nocardia sp. NBC_01327 TaxID=2903593 RepID=UPI002E16128B|nr:tyrosine-type recombinase/integrase [Nocardia sp. NBC_01327]